MRSPALIFLLLLALLIGFLAWRFPYALNSTESTMQLAYLALLATAIGGSIVAGNRLHWRQNVKYAIAWLGIAILLVVGYSFRDALLNNRLMAELLPNRPQIFADGHMVLRANEFGQFYIEGRVNDTPVNFLIDTGASDISLSQADARRAGIDVDNLKYARPYRTANGIAMGANITLNRLEIGSIIAQNVEASVNRGEMQGSLLGMTFLRMLSSYQVKGNTLTLVP